MTQQNNLLVVHNIYFCLIGSRQNYDLCDINLINKVIKNYIVIYSVNKHDIYW